MSRDTFTDLERAYAPPSPTDSVTDHEVGDQGVLIPIYSHFRGYDWRSDGGVPFWVHYPTNMGKDSVLVPRDPTPDVQTDNPFVRIPSDLPWVEFHRADGDEALIVKVIRRR
jgi:hypothetical protein